MDGNKIKNWIHIDRGYQKYRLLTGVEQSDLYGFLLISHMMSPKLLCGIKDIEERQRERGEIL